MCLTGGFALAMMVDDVVLAPVLSQPSLPFPLGASRKGDVGVSDADLDRARQRCEDEDLCVHCGLCAERCPTAAWDMELFDLAIPYAGSKNFIPVAVGFGGGIAS